MNLLDTLTRAADEEQLRLHPLPEHAAATQPEHLRQHYALLLASVLTAQPAVSEPQTRLLRLLLDALKLGDIRGQLFAQARELEPEPLLEAARLIRAAGFAHHLVVDVLVLLRLDVPLGDEAARMAGELAAFLSLDESALATRVGDASEILGLNAGEDGSINAGAGNKADGDDGAPGIPTAPPLLLAELWPGRLRQPLTREALKAGLEGGLWLLDGNLDVDFPWQANDAILFFRNDAVLNTFAKEGNITLTDCRLVNAVLDLQGACSITLERCDWQGSYKAELKRTALRSLGQNITITDCQFSTRDARSISAEGGEFVLNGSAFILCGHRELIGGAICWVTKNGEQISGWLHNPTEIQIIGCRFDNCTGYRMAAIAMTTLKGIRNCEFVFCRSVCYEVEPKFFGLENMAIMSFKGGEEEDAIQDSVFRNASLRLNNPSKNTRILSRCQFLQGGYLHVYKPYTETTFLSNGILDCNFEMFRWKNPLCLD